MFYGDYIMLKLENLQLLNTNSPRETLAYLDKDAVYKIPVSGKDPLNIKTWLDKQKLTRKVSDGILSFNNHTYKIPKVLEISDKDIYVKEERMIGTPLKTSFVETLTSKELDIIYRALANFTNDINQSRPVLTQKDTFDISTSVEYMGAITIEEIIKKLKKYIPEKELQSVKMAKEWFDVASDKDASVVFAHGDMNEHNIFFDKETKTVSIIDFAEAKYQNADYMFGVDYARLGWLDIDRLIKEYEKLPKKQPVNVRTNPDIKNMRNALYNFKSAAAEFLHKPNIATKIRIGIILQDIERIKKLYNQINSKAELNRATLVLKKDKNPENKIIKKVQKTK